MSISGNHKKYLFLISLLSICLSSCSNSDKPIDEPTPEPSSSVDFNKLNYVDDLLWFPDLKIEVNQKQFLNNFMIEFEDSELLFPEDSGLSFVDGYLSASKETDTFIVYKHEDKYQKINVSVAKEGTYKRAYTIADLDLKDKSLCSFGDSVTADETIGDTTNVYPRRFARKYEMNFIDNYAVGGTTATYCTFNENITSEYGKTEYEYLDGCDLVYNKLKDKTLETCDYVFISYGYNDLYYQVDVDAEGDDVICHDDTFANCHSFKGSFRYMIDCINYANPDAKIIIVGINYNEYDHDHHNYWNDSKYKFDKGIKYSDYRKALYEIGYEKDVKVIDTWNYTKTLFDYSTSRGQSTTWVYKDSVHLTAFGHKYICNYITNW